MTHITTNNRLLPLEFILIEEIIDRRTHFKRFPIDTWYAFNEGLQVGFGIH